MSTIISNTFNKHELESISTQRTAKRLCKSYKDGMKGRQNENQEMKARKEPNERE